VRPRPGQADGEPAAVIVERYRPDYAVRVGFAQARCADSQIVEVDADAPHAFGLGGMLARPTVLDYASGSRLRPALVLEPNVELSGAALTPTTTDPVNRCGSRGDLD
jgi:hypothetical protein